MTDEGELRIEDVKATINDNTKIVAITHVSNVLGTINDIKQLLRLRMNTVLLLVLMEHNLHLIWISMFKI